MAQGKTLTFWGHNKGHGNTPTEVASTGEVTMLATDFWPCDEPTQAGDDNWIMGGISDCVGGKAIPTVAVSTER